MMAHPYKKGGAWHALTCPTYRHWRRRHYRQPFWRDDRTAQMLGVAQFGCPRCGRGAIAERDAARRPSKVEVAGNYLNPQGIPVIATQLPESGRDVLGGSAVALGWCSRWIKAAGDVEVFLDGDGLQWDYGGARHHLRPGEWVVWCGTAFEGGFEVVGALEFEAGYAPVTYEAEAAPAPEAGGE